MSALKKIESNSFAEACYDQNTIGDLRDVLAAVTSAQQDCATWNLTMDQWRDQVSLAIAALEEGDDEDDEDE